MGLKTATATMAHSILIDCDDDEDMNQYPTVELEDGDEPHQGLPLDLLCEVTSLMGGKGTEDKESVQSMATTCRMLKKHCSTLITFAILPGGDLGALSNFQRAAVLKSAHVEVSSNEQLDTFVATLSSHPLRHRMANLEKLSIGVFVDPEEEKDADAYEDDDAIIRVGGDLIEAVANACPRLISLHLLWTVIPEHDFFARFSSEDFSIKDLKIKAANTETTISTGDLKKLRSLESLDLSRQIMIDEQFEALLALPHLRSVSLESVELTHDDTIPAAWCRWTSLVLEDLPHYKTLVRMPLPPGLRFECRDYANGWLLWNEFSDDEDDEDITDANIAELRRAVEIVLQLASDSDCPIPPVFYKEQVVEPLQGHIDALAPLVGILQRQDAEEGCASMKRRVLEALSRSSGNLFRAAVPIILSFPDLFNGSLSALSALTRLMTADHLCMQEAVSLGIFGRMVQSIDSSSSQAFNVFQSLEVITKHQSPEILTRIVSDFGIPRLVAWVDSKEAHFVIKILTRLAANKSIWRDEIIAAGALPKLECMLLASPLLPMPGELCSPSAMHPSGDDECEIFFKRTVTEALFKLGLEYLLPTLDTLPSLTVLARVIEGLLDGIHFNPHPLLTIGSIFIPRLFEILDASEDPSIKCSVLNCISLLSERYTITSGSFLKQSILSVVRALPAVLSEASDDKSRLSAFSVMGLFLDVDPPSRIAAVNAAPILIDIYARLALDDFHPRILRLDAILINHFARSLVSLLPHDERVPKILWNIVRRHHNRAGKLPMDAIIEFCRASHNEDVIRILNVMATLGEANRRWLLQEAGEFIINRP